MPRTRPVTVTDADEAKKFFPGDVVALDDGTNNEVATIASVTDVTLTLAAALTQQLRRGDGPDRRPRRRSAAVRVEDSTGFEPGTNARSRGRNEHRRGRRERGGRGQHVLTLAHGLTNAYGMDPVPTARRRRRDAGVHPRHRRGREVHGPLARPAPQPLLRVNQVDVRARRRALPEQPNPSPPPGQHAARRGGRACSPAVRTTIPRTWTRTPIQRRHRRAPDDRRGERPLRPRPHGRRSVQTHMIAHCELMQDRFAILDPRRREPTAQQISAQRDDARQRPRVRGDLLPADRRASNPIAPAGSRPAVRPPRRPLRARRRRARRLQGARQRASARRARPRAPARRPASRGRSTRTGINVIRALPGARHPWCGARARSRDEHAVALRERAPALLFIEESIQEGTQFVVFEPNDTALWEQVKRQVTEFLTPHLDRRRARRRDAGARRSACRVDEELNPPDVAALGQLVIEVDRRTDHAGGVRRVPDHPAARAARWWRRVTERGACTMANGDRVDPYRNFNFMVEIDGITQAGVRRVHRLRLEQRPDRVPGGHGPDDRPQAPGHDEVQQHHAQVGADRLARALRLVPRHHQGQDRAQERQHRPRRPRRQREGALELLPGLADEVGRAGLQRRGHRRRRSRRSRSPTKASRGPSHAADRARVHAAVRLPGRRRHAPPRGRHAAGDGRGRDPAAARRRACRRTRPT